MCYQLYLSTSSTENLSQYNSDWISFGNSDHLDDRYTAIVENERKWYVGSKSGCSCTFRHLAGGDLNFDEPQDWLPEEQDELKATAELYRVIASLVQGGEKVDCLDLWPGAEPAKIKTMSVNLSVVPEKAFRLFEDYHFVFEP